MEIVYNGIGDTLLDNEDVLGFANESELNKDFKITILNGTNTEQPLLLFPSLAPEPTPVVTDGTIGGITNFTASGDTHSIEFFKAAIFAMPTRVVKTTITTNNLDFFTKLFAFKQLRLGRKPIENEIRLEKYESVYQQNDKKIFISDDFQLDHLVQLKTIIPGAVNGVPTRVAITFEFGFSLDTAEGLRSKAKLSLKDPYVATARQSNK